MHLLSVLERGKSLQTFGDQRTVSREEIVELAVYAKTYDIMSERK